MRFSAVHKLATYLMSVSAYLALALSGELHSPAILLGAAGIAGSWFWEPPRVRPERYTVWWNALALGVLGYTLLSAFSTGDWIVAGADFLLFLLVNRLFNRRTSRDYQWVYVLTFLMLVAGTTLNAELSYALCFLGYVVFATWALILFHLRREMEDNFLLKHSNDSSSERVEVERILSSRRIVGPHFLGATSAVSLGIFLASALLFLIFPRVGFGFFFQRGHNRMTFAGFSDGVTLGGHGLIRNDPTVVMRVQVTDPRYRGAAAPELHWRAVAFDQYQGGKWSRSANAFRTQARAVATPERTRLILDDPITQRRFDIKNALRQEIFLEALDTSALFAAARPQAFELGNVMPGSAGQLGRLGQNDEVRYGHLSGLRYVAFSDPTPPSVDKMRAAPDADSGDFATYLEVPPEITPRLRQLAADITRDKQGPYQKAEAVLRHLRTGYAYTLQMESPGGREPLDDFLFERKAGHCEYFSSAMAILLRLAGVPTRNVDGFLGGEWNEYGGYIAVRGGDAHSWVEVWFDGVGWVTYDPTPPGQATPLLRGGGGFMDRMRRMVDTMRLQWFKWVMEYDLGRQLGLMRSIAGVLGIGEGGTLTGDAIPRWIKRHRLGLAIFVLALVALFAGPGIWRRRRARGRAGGGARRVEHPVTTIYARAARALAKRGHARDPAQTPREHARALLTQAVPGAVPYAALTEVYYTAVYATEALVAAVSLNEARALADKVREELAQPRR